MSDRKITFLAILLLVSGSALLGYSLLMKSSDSLAPKNGASETEIETHLIGVTAGQHPKNSVIKPISDHKLPGIIDPRKSYEVDKNYYDYNEIALNDVVWLVLDPPSQPFPRLVQGLPGDHFDVERDPMDAKKWYILINDKRATINGETYYFEYPGRQPILKNSVEVERGIIPPENYILLTPKVPGKNDSSNFGLFHKLRIKGKLIEVQE